MKEKEWRGGKKGARLSLHAKPGAGRKGEAEIQSNWSLAASPVRIKSILVPTDFSEASAKTLRYARKFAELFSARITVLHVIQPMVYPVEFGYPPPAIDMLDETMQQRVAVRLKELVDQALPEAQTIIRLGQPYLEITAAAKELNVDLIIISTHGHTGLRHVLLGSTAERVVRHASCPVLTARDREAD